MWWLFQVARAQSLCNASGSCYSSVEEAIGLGEDELFLASGVDIPGFTLEGRLTLWGATDARVLGPIVTGGHDLVLHDVHLSFDSTAGTGLWATAGRVTLYGGEVECTNATGIVATDATVELNDALLQGCSTAVSVTRGDLYVERTRFEDNLDSAVRLEDASAEFTDSTFSFNESGLVGGAIYALNSDLTLESNNVFEGNTARSGGGAIRLDGGELEVSGTGNRFIDNYAYSPGEDSLGGAVWASNNATVDLGSSRVEAPGHSGAQASLGGGVAVDSGVRLIVTGGEFNALESARGGAIYGYGASSIVVQKSDFLDTTADEGGALFVESVSDIDIDRTGFCNTHANTRAGAIQLITACSEACTLHNIRAGGTSSPSGSFARVESSNLKVEQATFVGLDQYPTAAFVVEGGSLQLNTSIFEGQAFSAAIGLLSGQAHMIAVDVSSPSAVDGNIADIRMDDVRVLQTIDWLPGQEPDDRWDCLDKELRIRRDGAQADRLSEGGEILDLGLYDGLNTDDLPEGSTDDEDGDGVQWRYDCHDNDPAIYPDALELCDGVDEDCDGEVDEDCVMGTDTGMDSTTTDGPYTDGSSTDGSDTTDGSLIEDSGLAPSPKEEPDWLGARLSGGCGCSTAPQLPSLALWLPLLWLCRRKGPSATAGACRAAAGSRRGYRGVRRAASPSPRGRPDWQRA